MKVTLTRAQMDDVTTVARTVMERYQAGVVTTMRFGKPDLRRFVASFGAELAVAEVAGMSWGHGDPRRADVGDGTEVRWSSERPPKLRVYDPSGPRSQDRGKLDRTFVLVTGWAPTYTVLGSAIGRRVVTEGRRTEHDNGTVSFYLDSSQLDPFPPTTECSLHGWHRDADGAWVCAKCGAPFA